MQFTPSLLAAFALLPLTTLANFHIYEVVATMGCGSSGSGNTWCNTYDVTLVPDGQLTCNNAANSKSSAGVSLVQSYMKVKNGICNSGPLDFYRTQNGGFDIYRAGGNGQVAGRCYATGGYSTCVNGLSVVSAWDKYWYVTRLL